MIEAGAEPAWSESTTTIELQRVANPATGARAVAVLGLVALTGLVMVGAIGGWVASGSDGVALPPGEAASEGRGQVADSGRGPAQDRSEDPIRLFAPGYRIAPVTGAVVRVKGELRIEAAIIRVALVLGRRDTLAVRLIDLSDSNGGVRWEQSLSFDVALAIPKARPTGQRVWVLITLYDEAGRALGATRRQVDIGPLGKIPRGD